MANAYVPLRRPRPSDDNEGKERKRRRSKERCMKETRDEEGEAGKKVAVEISGQSSRGRSSFMAS